MTAVDDLIRALRPVLQRVRRDVTAVKRDGRQAWTREPLTSDAMRVHVSGGVARGVCPIEEGASTTRLGLLDFDSHGGATPWAEMQAVAARVCDEMQMWGLEPTAWRSSGGRGIHVFVLWDEPQDAYSVRQALASVLEACGLKNGTAGVAKGEVEVFPKQDEVLTGEYGNQFILPLSGASEPLDIAFGLEPMGREFTTSLTWPMSSPVPVLQRPARLVVEADASLEPIERVRAALFAIPNDSTGPIHNYDAWRDLGYAVHEATGGGEEGRALFLEWSEQNPLHDAKFFERNFWKHIKPVDRRSRAVTRATLFSHAHHCGWADTAGQDTDGFDDVEPEAVAQVRAEDRALVVQRTADEDAEAERLAVASHNMAAGWTTRIAEAETVEDLQAKIARKIALEKAIGAVDRQLLADALKARFKELGADVTVALCRDLVAYKPEKTRAPTVKEALPLTEFGNTERMLRQFGDNLMFVPETARWYVWTGNHWEKCVGNEVQIEHMAKETIRGLVAEAAELDDDRLSEFFEFCKISQRAVMVRNMVTLASSDPRVVVPARELDKNTHLLGVRNGVVDLRTGALLPASKDLRITMTACCNYNPKARAPLFERTVSQVFFDNSEMIDFFERSIGYSTMGDPKEEVLFIPFGNGANGKGTLLNTIRQVLGDYAASAGAESFISDGKNAGGAGGAREDLVRLRGKRFVYVNEPDENGELREGAVKSMTGNDAMTARGLFAKDSVEILPSWVVFMPTNHKPIVKGSDNGIWRRLVLLPFERDFEKDTDVPKDKKLKEKLRAEDEGVLAWIVRAAIRYQRDGLVPPEAVRAARDSYRTQMDLLAEWLEECCEQNVSFEEPMQRLWRSWEQFAKDRGIINYVKSSTALARRLDSRFPSRKGTGGVRLRTGVRLKAEEINF